MNVFMSTGTYLSTILSTNLYYIVSINRAGPTTMPYVYVFSLLHTLGVQGVNHKQLPYGAFCMDYIYEVWVLILPYWSKARKFCLD